MLAIRHTIDESTSSSGPKLPDSNKRYHMDRYYICLFLLCLVYRSTDVALPFMGSGWHC